MPDPVPAQSGSLAKHPFWLDGGYDRESVEACPYHPAHRWWTFRLGDVLDCESSGRNSDEMMCICRGCYVPRCGHVENDPDPCILPRHHPELHLTASGAVEDATVWPGNKKPAPPRFSREDIQRMRTEMLTQFAPDTEMPRTRRRHSKGRTLGPGEWLL